jgi:hypothetical protein
MAITALRKRAARLEKVFFVDHLGSYPPLTDEEISALVERSAAGQGLTAVETMRMIRQCPYTQGGLFIRANQGAVTIKRLIGIDPSWI